jgi:hypothetical protein
VEFADKLDPNNGIGKNQSRISLYGNGLSAKSFPQKSQDGVEAMAK